ncbi:MAG: hypothetical protein CMP65_00260 [Flavobacteriales bacterium]|nr:hypothetical protein [Flavobacteriales bacterium]
MRNIFFYFLFITMLSSAQQDILFKVANSEVHVDDFLKNYFKNKLDSDTLSFEQSISEYIDLYIKFKLKVVEAEKLGIDTTQSFQRELSGYRSQLIKPYLTDINVSDQLLTEAYERLQYEVSASHILIQTKENDTINAYNKILEIQNKLNNGADFVDLAKRFSEDPSVKENNGNLGYFSALYMVYPFETAAFTTPVGNYSNPIRTRFGYHILKINDKRKSRGEVKVAHILIKERKKLNSDKDDVAEKKIYEVYDSLKMGVSFSDIAKRFSDDTKSAQAGGELDWFGTNKMVSEFENVSFSLDSIGDISLPFKTDFGWHIVKLLDKKLLPNFEEMRESLKKRIERDSRSQKTRDVVIQKLIQEWGFVENMYAKKSLINLLNNSNNLSLEEMQNSLTGKDDILFVFNNQYDVQQRYIYQSDFVDFFYSFKSRINKNENLKSVLNQLLSTFKEQKILEIESNNLEAKYDDFRLLFNEYHDGILMYQIQKEKVWDKAINDTLGLKNFFEINRDNYKWPQRVLVKIYSSKNANINSKVYRKLKYGIPDDLSILKSINNKTTLNLSIEELLLSEGDDDIVDSLVFSKNLKDFEKKSILFVEEFDKVIIIQDVINETPKLLSEIKGMVISDYQSFLEKKWLEELENKYQIVINENLFTKVKNKEYSLKETDVNQKKVNLLENFNSLFARTVKQMGSSANIFFGWDNQIYTTEIK